MQDATRAILAEADPDEFFHLPDYRAVIYKRLLESMHKFLRPRRYLEVGTLSGDTLQLAQCASLAIDPQFQVERNVIGSKPSCLFYQMASDAFFETYDPKAILGGPIDLAFLDGMHWFEFLLRDFINVEKHARKNSVIVMHDCMPSDSHVARRLYADQSLAGLSIHNDWWAGDVWKTAAILLKYRPDLKIRGCETPPTGLVTVTNLDPTSSLLSDRYFDIVAEYRDYPSNTNYLGQYRKDLTLISPETLLNHGQLSAQFWL